MFGEHINLLPDVILLNQKKRVGWGEEYHILWPKMVLVNDLRSVDPVSISVAGPLLFLLPIASHPSSESATLPI